MLLCPWDFPGKITGVGCHALLKGIFRTQGWNLGLLIGRRILYRLSHQRSPLRSAISTVALFGKALLWHWRCHSWLLRKYLSFLSLLPLPPPPQAFLWSPYIQTGLAVAQRVKRPPAMRETWVRIPGREDPLEKEIATHSSTLAWKIPRTEEPVRLQSMGLQSRTWLSNFT